MPLYIIDGICKGQVLEPYGAIRSFLDPLQAVAPYLQCGSGIWNCQWRSFMEIFSGHKAEMFGNLFKRKTLCSGTQCFEPLRLFGQPFTGEKRKEHTVPGEPFRIAVSL